MATLLLADDSVTIQRVIELTFANEDVRVISVGDGESAIARIDEERPDIVLADVGMPGVDGYQVAAHVKRSPASATVPVLLLTGAFEPIDEARARETGCDGVLVKPFEPRQLIKTVRDLLAGVRPAELWPADMPRLEPDEPRPVIAPVFVPQSVEVVAPVQPIEPIETVATAPIPVPPPPDEPHVLSIPYEPEADPDLAEALARLEFVDVPEEPAVADPVEAQIVEIADDPEAVPAPPLEWDLTVAPPAAAPRPPATKSLANVFSALLAAERDNPDARASIKASPSLSEAAVEEVVQKVVRGMTDELVRKIVLETAERLIREEIARIKA